MIQTFNDVLPMSVFKTLQHRIVHNDQVPWHFNLETAYKTDIVSQSQSLSDGYSFFHNVYLIQPVSSLYPFIEVCLLQMLEKAKIPCKEMIRVRLGLITNIGKANTHSPHVDYDDIENTYTGLLYLNNSDGDTVMYNEKFNLHSQLSGHDYIEKVLNHNFTERTRVTPVENKMVIMDGNIFHSSSNPMSVPARYVMNFNFKV